METAKQGSRPVTAADRLRCCAAPGRESRRAIRPVRRQGEQVTDRASAAHPVLPLVGRARHIEALAGHAAAARAGQPRLVLLDGPAGAGKTALLRAALAADGPFAGMTVLHGTCRAVDATTGYSGVRALFGRLGLTGRRGRASALLDGGARRALPALAAAPGELDAAPGGVFSVLQGLYWLAVNLMADGPLVLVLDDAHWCDERSLRWLDFLLRRADGLPLLVVAAHRTEAGHAAPDALADLVAHRLPAPLRLGPPPPEVAELAALVFPARRPEPSFVDSLLCGGDPWRTGAPGRRGSICARRSRSPGAAAAWPSPGGRGRI
ncbi:hypothetical protein SALBM135S_01062 [Streptomyces alboniger]